MVLLLGAGNSVAQLVRLLRTPFFAERFFSPQPIPSAVQAANGDLVRQDGRRPVERMDLRHQGDVDKSRFLEELLVVPVGVLGFQRVANRVVLVGEQRVHHGEAEPPVAVDSREVDALLFGIGVEQQQAVVQQGELAVLVGADLLLNAQLAAVDLRAVPPMGLGVEIAGRVNVVGVVARRVPGASAGSPSGFDANHHRL